MLLRPTALPKRYGALVSIPSKDRVKVKVSLLGHWDFVLKATLRYTQPGVYQETSLNLKGTRTDVFGKKYTSS